MTTNAPVIRLMEPGGPCARQTSMALTPPMSRNVFKASRCGVFATLQLNVCVGGRCVLIAVHPFGSYGNESAAGLTAQASKIWECEHSQQAAAARKTRR